MYIRNQSEWTKMNLDDFYQCEHLIFTTGDGCVRNCDSVEGWVILCDSLCKDYAYCKGGQMLSGPSGTTTSGLTCPDGKVFDTTTQACQHTSSTCPVPWKFKGNKSFKQETEIPF